MILLDHKGNLFYLSDMFKFLLKKNFADIWDNLFHLIIVNLFFLALCALAVLGFFTLGHLPVNDGLKSLLMILYLFFSSAFIHVFFFAEGKNAERISNYEGSKLSLFFSSIVSSIKDGALYGCVVALLICIAFITMPYYFRMWIPADGSKGSFLGLLFMALVFWLEVLALLSLQWFMAIRNVLHNNFKKCLKKSVIIFFDNPWLSIGIVFLNLFELLITVFTLGLIPGISGMTVTVTNAFRLRMYKYDWYEVNPGMTKEQRRDIPWDELLANEKQALGPRTLKSYFLPWKDN